jgi:hypothetical protein
LAPEEGFSQRSRGELTVLSEKKHTLQELSGLLDKGVSLSVTETLGDGKTERKRFLHGIITAVKDAGVFSNGKVKDCYRYVFVIEPELARLKFTRLSAPYYRMTPPDIFEAILGKYKLKAQIREDYLSRRVFGKNLMFDQSGASDFDFIKGIAGLYGISFTFAHPEVTEGALGEGELYFSEGKKFPLSDIVYSDNRKEPPIAAFDFLSAAEGQSIWKMDGWDMTAAIGFDGSKLNTSYPNANYGSDQWKWGKTSAGDRYTIQNHLFHGYDRKAETGEIDDDIALILAARRRAAEIAKSAWKGGAANLVLRPGLILELSHFYGTKDRDRITALVTGTRLHHRSVWPANLAVRLEGSGGEISEVLCECIDWGSGAEKRFV